MPLPESSSPCTQGGKAAAKVTLPREAGGSCAVQGEESMLRCTERRAAMRAKMKSNTAAGTLALHSLCQQIPRDTTQAPGRFLPSLKMPTATAVPQL